MANWSEEEHRIVEQLAALNYTATQISCELVNRSRNAVIGYLHRNGISFGKPRPSRTNINELRRETYSKMIARRHAIAARTAKVVIPPTRAQFEASESQLAGSTTKGVRFIDRLQFQCAWIYDTTNTAESMCCGRAVKGSSSWCPEHYALVFVPSASRPRSPKFERDRNRVWMTRKPTDLKSLL